MAPRQHRGFKQGSIDIPSDELSTISPSSPDLSTSLRNSSSMKRRKQSNLCLEYTPAAIPVSDEISHFCVDAKMSHGKRSARYSILTTSTEANSSCLSDADLLELRSFVSFQEKESQSTNDSFDSFLLDMDLSPQQKPQVLFAQVTLTEGQEKATHFNLHGMKLLRRGDDRQALEYFLQSQIALEKEMERQNEGKINLIGRDVAFICDQDGDDINCDYETEDEEYGFFCEVEPPSQSEIGLYMKNLETGQTLLCNPNDDWGMTVLILSETLNNIATVSWRCGQLNEAMELLLQAYKTVQEMSSTSRMPRRSSVLSYLSIADTLVEGSTDATEVKQCDNLRFPSTLTRIKYSDNIEQALLRCEIKILKGIGTVQSMQKSYTKAVNSFIQALRLHRRTRPIQNSSEDLQESDLLMGEASLLEEVNFMHEKYDLEMSFIVGMIASVYVACGEYTGALSMYQDVLSIKKSILGRRHASIAATLVDIAHVYYHQGKYDLAMCHYLKAAKLQEKLLGKSSCCHNDLLNGMDDFSMPVDVAVTWHYIGRVYHMRGEVEDALHVYKDVEQLYLTQGISNKCTVMKSLLSDMAQAAIEYNKINREFFLERELQYRKQQDNYDLW